MYMRKANNRRSVRFEQEIRIVEALRKRLADGDGWARITIKSDGQEIDISYTVDHKYYVTFPPYYDACKGPYKALNEWFNGLDEVAEFIMTDGWKRR